MVGIERVELLAIAVACTIETFSHKIVQQMEDALCPFSPIAHDKGPITRPWGSINTLRPRQNGRHFPDDIFKWISLNENVLITINISLKFVPRGPINSIPTLVQVMAWRWPGDKPLSEPMMVRLPTLICVTRLQWVKTLYYTFDVSAREMLCYTNLFTLNILQYVCKMRW